MLEETPVRTVAPAATQAANGRKTSAVSLSADGSILVSAVVSTRIVHADQFGRQMVTDKGTALAEKSFARYTPPREGVLYGRINDL